MPSPGEVLYRQYGESLLGPWTRLDLEVRQAWAELEANVLRSLGGMSLRDVLAAERWELVTPDGEVLALVIPIDQWFSCFEINGFEFRAVREREFRSAWSAMRWLRARQGGVGRWEHREAT